MGCANGHARPSEGDWNAAEVLSECRPYMFSLMAFEAMFLLYAEGLEGVVVDGRRLIFRQRVQDGLQLLAEPHVQHLEHDAGEQDSEPVRGGHESAFCVAEMSFRPGRVAAIPNARKARSRNLAALRGLWEGAPPARGLISTAACRTTRPLRLAITSASIVSPRYSAG